MARELLIDTFIGAAKLTSTREKCIFYWHSTWSGQKSNIDSSIEIHSHFILQVRLIEFLREREMEMETEFPWHPDRRMMLASCRWVL